MNDKQCKIGVQLMPLLLIVLAAFYYAFGSKIICAIFSVIALLMWVVLLSEDKE